MQLSTTLSQRFSGDSTSKPHPQQHVSETGLGDVQVGLEEYVARMKPDQKQIYYLSGAQPLCLCTPANSILLQEILTWPCTC